MGPTLRGGRDSENHERTRPVLCHRGDMTNSSARPRLASRATSRGCGRRWSPSSGTPTAPGCARRCRPARLDASGPRRPPGHGAPLGGRHDPRRAPRTRTPSSTEGIDAADPLDWLGDGAIDLVTALVRAPDDLEAPVFLHDAPAPREFWARRQCHETTIHAVDALAARWAASRGPRTPAGSPRRSPSTASTSCSPASSPGRAPGCAARAAPHRRASRTTRGVAWTVDVGPTPGGDHPVDPAARADGDSLLRGLRRGALPDPLEPQRRRSRPARTTTGTHLGRRRDHLGLRRRPWQSPRSSGDSLTL